MDQAEEIRQIIEQASQGYWMPITIVSLCFSLIISLLIYIWNQMLKQNERRHQEHEKHNEKQDQILEKVTDSLNQLTIHVKSQTPVKQTK